jgi:hypothetical protein
MERQSMRVTTPYFFPLLSGRRLELYAAINPAATNAPHSLIPLDLQPYKNNLSPKINTKIKNPNKVVKHSKHFF